MSDTPTYCGEHEPKPGSGVCGELAVGPHPTCGFIRPLCYRHLALATTAHHEEMDRIFADMEDEGRE